MLEDYLGQLFDGPPLTTVLDLISFDLDFLQLGFIFHGCNAGDEHGLKVCNAWIVTYIPW